MNSIRALAWARRPLMFTLAAAMLGGAVPGQASTPGSATISAGNPDVKWTGGPLTGSAPAVRRISCQEGVNCDALALTVDLAPSDKTATVSLNLTPDDSNSQMTMILYAPGCPVDDPTSSCYTSAGSASVLTHPTNGLWHVRVTCTVCASSTYHAEAVYGHVAAARPQIPDSALGSQAFTTVPLAGGPSSNGEPGISVNKYGEMVANTFGPTVWTSPDNGRSWSAANTAVDTTQCIPADADAVYANDHTIYADQLCYAGFEDFFYYSHDGGKTWNSDKINLPSIAGLNSDRQWITVDPKNPQIVYLEFHSLAGDNSIWVYKSTDGGSTFIPGNITLDPGNAGLPDNTVGGNITSKLLVDPGNDNNLYVIWGQTTAQQGATTPPTAVDSMVTQVWVAASTDQGATWTTNKAVDDGNNTIGHLFPASAIDNAGNIYFAYSERINNGTNMNTHLKLTHSSNHGQTWSTPVQVDRGTGFNSNLMPWMAAGGDAGKVDFIWEASAAMDWNDTGAAWSVIFGQTLDALSPHPSFTETVVSPLNHHADICTVGIFCQVTGGNRNLSDYIMIDTDVKGLAHLIWTDDTSGKNVLTTAYQTGGAGVRGAAVQVVHAAPPPVAAPPPPAPSGDVHGANRNLPNTGGAPSTPWLPLSLLGLAMPAGALLSRRLRPTG